MPIFVSLFLYHLSELVLSIPGEILIDIYFLCSCKALTRIHASQVLAGSVKISFCIVRLKPHNDGLWLIWDVAGHSMADISLALFNAYVKKISKLDDLRTKIFVFLVHCSNHPCTVMPIPNLHGRLFTEH